MALGSDKLGKSEDSKKSKNIGYKTDVYSIIDELLHDDSDEIVVSMRNKYFAIGLKYFLEEMNYTFLDSEITNPRIIISLPESSFKFIDHMEDAVSMELPYDWDTLENKIRDYVSENPVVKKEHTLDMTEWNTPTDQQGQYVGDIINENVDNIKEWVREIQKNVNIGSEDAAKMAEKHIKRMFHTKNETTYTALGNPNLHLTSGIYNNIEDLINKNGWKLQFESDYKMSMRQYMRDHSDIGTELKLLSDFGFEYIKGDIIVTENKYWTNRIIEVKYKDQDHNDIDSIIVNESEFENIPTEPIENVLEVKESVISSDMESILIKSYSYEEPIFIVGCSVGGYAEVRISQGFTSVPVKSGDMEFDFESNGSMSILSVDTFKDNRNSILETDMSILMIPKMIGDVMLNTNQNTKVDLSSYLDTQLDINEISIDLQDDLTVLEVNAKTVDIIMRKFKL